MKHIQLIPVLFTVIVAGCEFKQEPSPEYMKQAKFSGSEYTSAASRADNNDPSGYLKLYEIASNESNLYTTDWSEVAGEKLFSLLYSNTALWVNTFSKVDLVKFRGFVGGIEVSNHGRPDGVSNEQFKETIFKNLENIKGDKREMELVDHILGLYNRKRK